MTNAWELFRTGQKQKIGMLEFQRLSWQFWHLLEEISLQSHWRFHEMFQAM